MVSIIVHVHEDLLPGWYYLRGLILAILVIWMVLNLGI